MSSLTSSPSIARATTIGRRAPEITLTAREKQAYGQLWAAIDPQNSGFITGATAVLFFAKSGLPQQLLGQIWVIADADNKGILNQQGFSIAVKLISHAQAGKVPTAALVAVDAPLPRFEGFNFGSEPLTAVSPTFTGPTVTAEDRTKYGGMFLACGPVNGLLDGDKAREVFMKSKLPVEKLGQIWNLADTKRRGSLDVTDFVIAMHYIQHTMDGSIVNLPSTLPDSVLKASAGLAGASPAPLQSLSRQSTGAMPQVARQVTGSVGIGSSPLAKQFTGFESTITRQTTGFGTGNDFFGTSSSLPAELPWDISAEEKHKFDKFFDQLDPTGQGFVSGDDASKFFMNSRLSGAVLSEIWDLSDITQNGTLSRDEFAVAMYLINRKNATNAPVPKFLPPTLVPPSLRNRASVKPPTSAFGSDFGISARGPQYAGVEASRTMPTLARRQSFDLLGDGPLTSSTSTAGPSGSAAEKDLMGTEDLTSKITKESGEMAAIQNQISSLSAVSADLQTKRAMLEKNLSTLSAQKQDMSIRLNQVKSLHENETKTLNDLQSNMATIQPQLMKLREDLAFSERELAIASANKDQFLQALAKDQEESNQIKLKLRQNQEETARHREQLEAMKKDTTRQKNLLEISRRQLSASESTKQKVMSDIEAERQTQAQLGNTPAAASSPVVSSASIAPPPPAPRGSRKEPPPPPASRATGSPLPRSSPAEVEEAFGIPPALRSPTGSFRSAHSPSPFEPIPRQGTGLSARAMSIVSVAESTHSNHSGLAAPTASSAASTNIWSPATHAAQNEDGMVTFTKSPEVLPVAESNPFGLADVADAAAAALPISPPTGSDDPFSSMAFPAVDTPPVTKMDFDSAFTGFGAPASKKAAASNDDGFRSPTDFASDFPDISSIEAGLEGSTSGNPKRVSAFGFEDDFSGDHGFGSSTGGAHDEFPPIVEVQHQEEDSSDDEDDEVFVNAKSSIASPDSNQGMTQPASFSDAASTLAPPAPAPAISTAQPAATTTAAAATEPPLLSPTSAAKKLTSADFREFESFGDSDLDSAFQGIELAPPKTAGQATQSLNAFDDSSFDFNANFDDAFGAPSSSSGGAAATGFASSSPFGQSHGGFGSDFASAFGDTSQIPNATPLTVGAGGEFHFAGSSSADLNDAFGGSPGGFGAPSSNNNRASASAFGDSFGDFEAGFSSFGNSETTPSTGAPATGLSLTEAPSSSTPAPTTASAAVPPTSSTTAATTTTTTSTAAPPMGDLAGVEELMNMGFSRDQANSALLRYDTVERAANFLLEGGQ